MKRLSAAAAFFWLASSPALAQETGQTRRVVAGEQFRRGGFSRMLFGDNYRDLWTTPVELPVLDMKSFAGGLEAVRRLGHGQTKALALAGADGSAYTFRPILKDPVGLLPPELHNTMAARFVRDQMSSQHPAGHVIVPGLSEALGLLHNTPRLVLMPDDPALGPPSRAVALGQRLDDGVIESAVRRMPKEWFAKVGEATIASLERRRDALPRQAAAETGEVRIYLLAGNDRVVTRGPKGGITVRVIGGPGEDAVDDSAAGGLQVSDADGQTRLRKGTGTALDDKRYEAPPPSARGDWMNELQPLGVEDTTQLGAIAGPTLDTTDRTGLPTRGLRLVAGGSAYPAVAGLDKGFGGIHGAAAAYLTKRRHGVRRVSGSPHLSLKTARGRAPMLDLHEGRARARREVICRSRDSRRA